MKILNRAKSIYSDEYLISEDIKFELGLMYLRINGKWKECDKDTRSINFEDMLDSQGNKIFASLQEDGKGGCIAEYNGRQEIIKYSNGTIQSYMFRFEDLKELNFKAIGIQE